MSFDGRKVVAWIPYGRKATVEILFKYLRRDHEAGLIDELWLYLNTDTDQADDVAYAIRLEQQHTWVKQFSRPSEVPIFAQKQRNTCYFYRYAARNRKRFLSGSTTTSSMCIRAVSPPWSTTKSTRKPPAASR